MVRGKIDIPELQPALESAGADRVIYHHADKESRRPGAVVTVCTIFDGDHELAHGYARLHPRDHFAYATGRAVSLRRAVESLDIKGRRTA